MSLIRYIRKQGALSRGKPGKYGLRHAQTPDRIWGPLKIEIAYQEPNSRRDRPRRRHGRVRVAGTGASASQMRVCPRRRHDCVRVADGSASASQTSASASQTRVSATLPGPREELPDAGAKNKASGAETFGPHPRQQNLRNAGSASVDPREGGFATTTTTRVAISVYFAYL